MADAGLVKLCRFSNNIVFFPKIRPPVKSFGTERAVRFSAAAAVCFKLADDVWKIGMFLNDKSAF